MSEPLPADPEVPEDLDDGAGPPAGWSGGRRTVLVGLAVALAVVAGAVIASLATRAPDPVVEPFVAGDDSQLLASRPSPDERMPLPDVEVAGFTDGDPPVELASYRGTPLIVNFWASWCAPCVAEMPDFQAFHEAAGDEVALLGVNVQDAPRNAQAFVDNLGITYDLARDPEAELYRAVRGFGMPTTLFVDEAGTVVFRRTGMLEAVELRELVAEHFGVEVEAEALSLAGSWGSQ